MELDLSRFRETFFAEAADLAAELDRGVLDLERLAAAGERLAGPELLNAIFRAAHSIKGNAGMLGFDSIAGFTHSLETLLDRLRSGAVAPDREITGALVEASAALGQLLDLERRSQPGAAAPVAPASAELAARLLALSEGAAKPPADSLPWNIRFRPAPDFFLAGLDPVLILGGLERAGSIAAVTPCLDALPALGDLDPERCYLSWDIVLEAPAGEETAAAIGEAFALAEGAAEIEIAVPAAHGLASAPASAPGLPPPPASSPVGGAAGLPPRRQTSIRVDTAKVDKLINLAGELVTAQAMAASVAERLTPERVEELRETLTVLGRHTREIQERVMSIRMLPASAVFGRFPRLVRDVAAATGKQVRLEIAGDDTELDRGLIERIADPLTHLVRNAIDHGIEPAGIRAAAGKKPEGVLRLEARHRAGSVEIEVSDDGRGLDAARIRRRAVEQGLIAPGAALSDERVLGLVFEAGFSTADRVTDLSGRGVGLDVVRRNVAALGGRIRIQSRPGQGAAFTITVPLTLAIVDGLLVRLAGEMYVLPLTAVAESVQVTPGSLVDAPGCGRLFRLRGEALPALSPAALLGVAGRRQSASRPDPDAAPGERIAVVVEADGCRAALLVDGLCGQQQVVVKSMEENYGRVDGVLGAAILANSATGGSRVAMIIDAAGLLRLAPGTAASAPFSLTAEEAAR
ncbi:MAG: chemotaxis protein CheA [Bryobacteraceae bacterium]